MNRYVFGVLAAFVVIIAAIILIFSRGGNDSDRNVPLETGAVELVDYAESDATTRLTIQGEIKGQNEYDEVRISVNRNTRTIEHVRGYTGKVVNRETFPNTDEAYDVFLHALDNAGFADDQKTKFDSEKGVCPFGKRFIYEVTENGDQRLRLWATSCSRREGSMAGDIRDIQRLFEAQIPSHKDFVREIKL